MIDVEMEWQRDHCTDTARVNMHMHAHAHANAGTIFFTVRAEMTPTYTAACLLIPSCTLSSDDADRFTAQINPDQKQVSES
jgi:hypothetical protein